MSVITQKENIFSEQGRNACVTFTAKSVRNSCTGWPQSAHWRPCNSCCRARSDCRATGVSTWQLLEIHSTGGWSFLDHGKPISRVRPPHSAEKRKIKKRAAVKWCRISANSTLSAVSTPTTKNLIDDHRSEFVTSWNESFRPTLILHPNNWSQHARFEKCVQNCPAEPDRSQYQHMIHCTTLSSEKDTGENGRHGCRFSQISM